MSIMTEKYGLKVGDKIVIGEDNDGECKKAGDILVISEDWGGMPIPDVTHLDGSFAGGFDLTRSGWEKYNEFPLKRDSKITLELTGEQVFWIAFLTGRTNGNWDEKLKLYETTSKMLNSFSNYSRSIDISRLFSSADEVEKVMDAAFTVQPKIEELTLEQVCKELGRDVKIVKNEEV